MFGLEQEIIETAEVHCGGVSIGHKTKIDRVWSVREMKPHCSVALTILISVSRVINMKNDLYERLGN